MEGFLVVVAYFGGLCSIILSVGIGFALVEHGFPQIVIHKEKKDD